jgi:amino acid transporter
MLADTTFSVGVDVGVPHPPPPQMMATAPEESVNPTRDVPLAIGISVGGCTILYLLMALVISGQRLLVNV